MQLLFKLRSSVHHTGHVVLVPKGSYVVLVLVCKQLYSLKFNVSC